MENIKSEKVLTAKELASYFDHTLLRANATVSEFKKLCDDSKMCIRDSPSINPVSFAACFVTVPAISEELCNSGSNSARI